MFSDEKPGDDLLDILRRVMMACIDQYFRLRSRRAAEKQGHSPISNIGVVEGGFEWFVLHE